MVSFFSGILILAIQSYVENCDFMKKQKIVRIESVDREVHFVFEECKAEPCLSAKGYSEVEARKETKQEAAKPLCLLRQ
jgi:hypothetical protein